MDIALIGLIKDISKENEMKLKDMIKVWDKEAKKYGVNPLWLGR